MIAEKAGSCTGCSVFNLSALSLSRLALREVFFDHIMFFECFSNNFTIRAFHRSLKCFQSLLKFAHGDVLILKLHFNWGILEAEILPLVLVYQ